MWHFAKIAILLKCRQVPYVQSVVYIQDVIQNQLPPPFSNLHDKTVK